jgi:diguanylate cyclase (GGDEF)-like protein
VTLDFPTLLACYALLRILQAAGLVYIWHAHRGVMPLGELAAGSALVVLGLVATLADIEPTETVVTVLLIAGMVVFNVGLVRLADRPAPWMLAAAWALPLLALRLALVFVWPEPALGVIVATLLYVGCASYSAIALFRVAPGPLALTQKLLAATQLIQIAAAVERAAALVGGTEHTPVAVLESTVAQTAFLLAAMTASFLMTLLVAVLASQRLQRALHVAANVDPLTGLMNRRAFAETAERDWAQAVRANRKLSVLLLDLDHFKEVNDVHGHDAGDEVLRKVSEALTVQVREGDLVARFGGEEFVIMMPDTSAREAMNLAERIRSAIGALNGERAGMAISVSIGVAEKSKDETNWAELVAKSDKALYVAKESGRNRVVAATDARARAA